MTDHICDLSPCSEDPESARALLYRHGLPEDVIDGALALHAQELAALQRLRMDELDLTGQKARLVGRIVDLIDPTRTAAPAVPVSSPPADQTAELANLRAMYDAVSTREHDLRAERDEARQECTEQEQQHNFAMEEARGRLAQADKAYAQLLAERNRLRTELDAARMADETQLGTEAPARDCPSDCPCRRVCIGRIRQPVAGARQDGADCG